MIARFFKRLTPNAWQNDVTTFSMNDVSHSDIKLAGGPKRVNTWLNSTSAISSTSSVLTGEFQAISLGFRRIGGHICILPWT